MAFEKKDFEKLLWNVSLYDLDRDDLSVVIPEIGKIEEFNFDISLPKNKVIAYIVYTYDLNSPFVKKYESISKRKKYAASEAGFEHKDYKYAKDVEDMIDCDNVVINGMSLKYCQLQMNDEWTALCTYKEALYSELKKLKNPDKDDKIKDIIETTKKLREEIRELTLRFLVRDNTDGLVYDFHSAIETDELIPRPEEIASRIARKEKVLPDWVNPYKEVVNE